MKRAVFILLVVLGTLTSLTAQDPVDIKGAWNMTVESPQGATPMSLNFAKVEGENVTGTLSSPRGDLDFSGTLKGSDIHFTATFDANGRSLTLTFTGKVTKDSMSGEADFGGMATGAWSAKRPG